MLGREFSFIFILFVCGGKNGKSFFSQSFNWTVITLNGLGYYWCAVNSLVHYPLHRVAGLNLTGLSKTNHIARKYNDEVIATVCVVVDVTFAESWLSSVRSVY